MAKPTYELCVAVTVTEISEEGKRKQKLSVPITCYDLSNEERVETEDMIFNALTQGFSELERSRLGK